jgi:sugar phosphate isomerase/epimerase
MTALEHLGAFARPLGVKLLVENLLSDATTPEHLLTILDMGHLQNVSVCLDLGHAHIGSGATEAIATLGNRIGSVHMHDNHGTKDEHLWPGDGTTDWPAVAKALGELATPPAAVLEISHTLNDPPATLPDKVKKSFDLL